jgi:hypothetical protein
VGSPRCLGILSADGGVPKASYNVLSVNLAFGKLLMDIGSLGVQHATGKPLTLDSEKGLIDVLPCKSMRSTLVSWSTQF